MSINRNISSVLKFSFFLGLGIFLVWWSIKKVDNFDEFKASLTTANYWMILPVFLILSTSHLLRALRWKLLMQPMGYKPSLANTFFAVMIGYLANFAFPRLGEILKCTILSKYEKIPVEKNVGTIVAERAFDVVCLLLLFIVALALQYDVVIAAFNKLQHTNTAQKEANNQFGFYLKLFFVVMIIVFFIWIIITKKWQLFLTKIRTIIKGISEGLLSAWNLKQKYLFIGYSIAIWMLYLLGTWIGLYATKGSELGFGAALSALAFASIGMVVTPGGIGSYAILIAMVLEIYGVNKNIGLANGTLQWFAQFIIIMVVGFVCLILLPIYNKKRDRSNIDYRDSIA